MSSSLFITGSSGFIAGHLLQRMDLDRYEGICCLGRSPSEITSTLSRHDNFQFVRGDLLDTKSYESHLATADTVVHLAAITGKARQQDYFEVNANGTALLTDKCRELGVPNFLYVSSIAAGYKNVRHYHYALSKRRGEEIVRKSGLKYTIIRPTIVLGPRAPGWHSLRKMAGGSILAIPGDGRAEIQPIHVDDLVACILLILNDRIFRHEVLDLGGPEAVTIEDFLRRLHRRMRGRSPRVVHLPLGLIRGCLAFVESYICASLPVSAGQFAVFGNDGRAADNHVSRRCRESMKNVDSIFEVLLDG